MKQVLECTADLEQPLALYSETRLRVLYYFITRYNTAGEKHPFKGYKDFKKHFYMYKSRSPEFFQIRRDKLEYLAIVDDFLMNVEYSLKSIDFMTVDFLEPDVFNDYFRIVVTVHKNRIKNPGISRLCEKILRVMTCHEFMRRSVHHWLNFSSAYHYAEDKKEIKITKIVESKLENPCVPLQAGGFTSILNAGSVKV